MTTSAAAMSAREMRNARPMRRSSASTSSSGSGLSRCNGWRRREHRTDLTGVACCALQRIDHHGLGRVIGGRVGDAVLRYGRVARVVIRLIALIELALLLRAHFIAQGRGDQRQVVVSRKILAIKREHFLEPL